MSVARRPVIGSPPAYAASRLLALLLAATAVAAPAARAQHAHPDEAKVSTTGSMADDMADMHGAHTGAPHMRMSSLRPAAPGDSARAATLADAVRREIARYRDVRDAERAGYRPIFVGDTAPGAVLHYTNIANGIWERWRLDPAKPGSLLYEKERDGSLRLVGAMFGAPDGSTPEQLDARVPLSIARWHLHTDLCLPRPVWDRAQWARTLPDGRPAFGPESPVATKAACDQVGGNFKDHVFGWMVHAMVVDNATPAAVWSGEHRHAMEPMVMESGTVKR